MNSGAEVFEAIFQVLFQCFGHGSAIMEEEEWKPFTSTKKQDTVCTLSELADSGFVFIKSIICVRTCLSVRGVCCESTHLEPETRVLGQGRILVGAVFAGSAP